jgi:choline transporter-like protein 2/4/5
LDVQWRVVDCTTDTFGFQDIIDLCSASPDCYVTYDWDNKLMYAFIYHLFGLLWTNQFIVGFASVVVAGSVAQYYWNR